MESTYLPAIFRYLVLFRYFVLVASLILLGSRNADAAVQQVFVRDHVYSPANVTINVGDTVRWVWQNDFHNVVAGSISNGNFQPTDAFNSGVLNTGAFYEVVFDRNMLKNAPISNDLYNYYCEPHAFMGMTGSVKVRRVATSFVAAPRGFQAVPATGSTASGSCTLTLNAQETQLSVNCSHNAAGVQAVQLRRGSVGSTGSVVCSLPTSASFTTSCALSASDADLLFNGDLHINVATSSFPAGEIRGQISRSGGSQSISGKVTLTNGQGLAGVTISDGARSTVTSTTGSYLLSGVPNGTYELTGTKSGYAFSPSAGTNPAFVNGSDLVNRNFVGTSAFGGPGDNDGDGVSNATEANDGSNANDPGSFRTHLKSPIQVLWNGFLKMINIVEIVNRGASPLPITLTVYDIAGVQRHQFSFAIAAAGQQDVILNTLPGFQEDSYGIVTLEFPTGYENSIDGRIFYYRTGTASDYEYAFGVPFVAPSYGTTSVGFNTFQPSSAAGEGQNIVAQWLSIANLSASGPKQFTLSRYAQDGSLLSQNVVSIPALGRTDFEAGHINPGPGFVGLIQIEPADPAAPYLAQLMRYGGNAPAGRTASAYSFAFPLLAHAGNGESQRAIISTGAGAMNWLEVANVLGSPISVTLEFFDANGTLVSSGVATLAAHAQQHFNAGALLPAGTSGSVRVTPSVPNAIIGQSMFYFRNPQTGSITAMYGSALQEAFGNEQFGSYNLFLGMSNWLKIFNLRDTATEVTVTVHNSSGNPNVRVIQLAPNQGIDLGLHDTASFGTSLNTYGVVQLETEQSGAVLGELVRFRMFPNGLVDFAAPTAVR